jgi:hypothetical protein
MRRLIVIPILALIMVLSSSTISKAASMPVGGCPKGFELMEVMDHDDMEHTHAGLKVDLNKDGYLCMSMATSSIHVHMDNVVPLH